MTAKTLKTLFKLSNKQKRLVAAVGLIWLSLITIFEISSQFENKKEVFYQNIGNFIQAKNLDQKRSETVLNALSEYYTSQTLKSNADFRHFSQGLLNIKTSLILRLV